MGTLLYYGRAVDPTLAATLSSIAARQANGTEDVKAACHQLLDYCATHPNAGVRYTASDMILKIHSDASYLSELGSKSRAAGHFYLSSKGDNDTNNGAILTLSSIIKHVMTSATEAELAALFYNCKTAVPLRVTLMEMGHEQPATPVTTDNAAAHGLLQKSMTPNAKKSMCMRFDWLKDPTVKRMFDYRWERGYKNRADYHSKKHSTKHYITERPNHVVNMKISEEEARMAARVC